jgi:hypothetical protein
LASRYLRGREMKASGERERRRYCDLSTRKHVRKQRRGKMGMRKYRATGMLILGLAVLMVLGCQGTTEDSTRGERASQGACLQAALLQAVRNAESGGRIARKKAVEEAALSIIRGRRMQEFREDAKNCEASPAMSNAVRRVSIENEVISVTTSNYIWKIFPALSDGCIEGVARVEAVPICRW